MHVGYLIPEFPGQTQIWMWREVSHLRSRGARIRIFGTRPPSDRDRARHAFAEAAEAETVYLWPRSFMCYVWCFAWAAVTRFPGLVRCLWLAMRLPVTTRPRWRHVLPLVLPACVLAWEMRRSGVQHLHSQSCKSSAILAMMVKRLIGIPFSLVLNANIDWWGGAMREKFSESAFIVTHARWLLDQVRRDFPDLPEEHAFRATVGVDTDLWRPAESGRRPEHDVFRIVTVGRLHASKGHDVLIRAVDALKSRGLEVELRIIGAGPAQKELEGLVSALGLEKQVFLLGSQSEERVREEIDGADVFAGASHSEPLGVVFMEAMAMGVATIGTAAGGVGEIIISGESGLLVPPGDPDALAAALYRLASDNALRASLAAEGRARVVREFDSRIGADLLYERLFV